MLEGWRVLSELCSVIKQAAAQLEVLEEENLRKRRKLERQIDTDGTVSLDLSKDR